MEFAPATFGDFWLSGTDLGCDSNFRWCTLSRDFVDPEVKWKEGHPKPGLDCVYLELRNGSALLATDNCAQNKSFLCEVRKKATFQRAMQTECAETWDITVDQIDLLMNVTTFLTATISLNLKFGIGGLDALATLRQIELVSQEEPTKLERGFVAYDQCSGIIAKINDTFSLVSEWSGEFFVFALKANKARTIDRKTGPFSKGQGGVKDAAWMIVSPLNNLLGYACSFQCREIFFVDDTKKPISVTPIGTLSSDSKGMLMDKNGVLYFVHEKEKCVTAWDTKIPFNEEMLHKFEPDVDSIIYALDGADNLWLLSHDASSHFFLHRGSNSTDCNYFK
ncbi:uncharacterized protein LOC135943864 [Cloeon dipterum]|uniref:uncharacterized protein LOC135943864 n=1 Tax=Cloeon dipterum TaxID=197152 RepID=UPI00321F64A1